MQQDAIWGFWIMGWMQQDTVGSPTCCPAPKTGNGNLYYFLCKSKEIPGFIDPLFKIGPKVPYF